MTHAILLRGGENTWKFSDMVQQKIRGIPELENQIGDIDEALETKVDKVEGKGLSTNDYTDDEKTKLANIEKGNFEASITVGSNNTSLSANTLVSGANNMVGGKAFKIVAEPTGTVGSTGTYTLDSVEGIEAGMVYSAVTSIAAYHQGTIQNVDSANNTVTVNNYAGYGLNKNSDGSIKPNEPDNYNFYNTFLLDDHPELGTFVIGANASAFGQGVNAHNVATHAEGKDTKALGKFSHAEGLETIAGHGSHAEGAHTKALGAATHAEGDSTTSDGHYSHAEGYKTKSSGKASHAEGVSTEAIGDYSHSEGESTKAMEIDTHAEGYGTEASGKYSHTEGYQSKSSGFVSHAEGCRTESSGEYSHSQGNDTIAQGKKSHAEGQNTYAKGENSHAEGLGSNTRNGNIVTAGTTGALGNNSHSEGNKTTASGGNSHAEGQETTASGSASHAEGVKTVASGAYSHAEGNGTQALGALCHTEGENTIAREGIKYAHVEGQGTIAGSNYQHVQGKYNIEDTSGSLVHIVGYGTANNPKNIHTIDKHGNAWFAGDITGKNGKLLSESELFEEKSFGWTEFEYDYTTSGSEDIPNYEDNSISCNDNNIYTIHCAGSILGFDFYVDSIGTYSITINGITYSDETLSIPLTYMTSDITIQGSFSSYNFFNMVKQSMKILDNVYTKAETDIAIANAPHLKRAIATELPDIGDTNTIYMVPSGENDNITILYSGTMKPDEEYANVGPSDAFTNGLPITVEVNGKIIGTSIPTITDINGDGEDDYVGTGFKYISVNEHLYIDRPTDEEGMPIDGEFSYVLYQGTRNTNIYLEYMYLNDSWEQIGSSEVDLTNYVKNTDYATNDKHGIIKGDTALGIRINTSGAAYIDRATEAQIDAKADKFKPIVPSNLEYAVKSVGDGYYIKKDETLFNVAIENNVLVLSKIVD
jgi:hypothetical protein